MSGASAGVGGGEYGPGPIAVVGLAGRFPGAPDVDVLWRNLEAGVESIRHFSRDELLAAGMPAELAGHPELVPAGALLDGIELFDARFFGYSPREAELIDPQQRLFLEACWQVLESAGYGPGTLGADASVGVYAGATLSSYLFQLAAAGAAGGGLWQTALAGSPAGAANAPDFFATRVAYKLDLRGPAYTVATACSTGLVAVHLACQALLAYETDLALAGAASVRVPHTGGYIYQESGILSPDGHTRPFDERARGTLFGHGVGVVALKRLEDALDAGDTVFAVVRGSATNNDGGEKVGFTAPSLRAQAEVIAEALAAADVEPETVTLVEAHGTGTALGDPIEVAALSRAFATSRRNYCALGSIKSNIGHLDAAAGISGFIKAVLALHHRVIPPSLNFERPNPKLDLGASPFRVPREAVGWEAGEAPRRAGVSSFGFGGTNAHAVLEEAPLPPAPAPSRPYQLLVLSARSPAAVDAAAAELAGGLVAAAPDGLPDTAHTLQVGRRPFAWRRAAVAGDAVAAAAAVTDPRSSHTAECREEGTPVVFLFPGQGSQHPGMGRGLYATEPTYRHWIDAAAERLAGPLGLDLRRLLGLIAADDGREEPDAEASAELLRRTRFTQPALFAVEHALSRLWIEWGVRPAAMLGHSVGEYVAACLAGVFSFEDALDLVALRGRLMDELPPGSMLAVDLDERALEPHLGPGVELAAVNAPGSTVVAGPHEAVRQLAERLAAAGVEHRRLHTSHAFHTVMMEPVLTAFRRAVEGTARAAPSLPFVSCVSGTWIDGEQATDPDYWCRQLRRPVRFAAGLAAVAADPRAALLEVGPSDALTHLARRHPAVGAERTVVASLAHPRRPAADGERVLAALGRLWLAGAEVDWSGFWRHERRRRVPLPTYPFERQRHWVEAPSGQAPVSPPPVMQRAISTATAPAETGTATEIAVARLFAEALGVPAPGLGDDFFELGGDSLIATRLLTRLRDTLGVKVPLDRVFATPTVAGLAAAADEIAASAAGNAAGGADEEPIPRRRRGGPAPLSSGQQRLWFLHQLDPGSPVYNLPGALRLRGVLDRGALHRALAEVLRRHEVLRTRLPAAADGGDRAASAAGRAVQIVAERFRLPLPTVDLSALPRRRRPGEAERATRRELARPFDLAAGPLLRALLVGEGERAHRVLVTTHHTVSDGWSWGLIAREVAALYRAAVAVAPGAEDALLPPLPIQYADYAAWQRSRRDAGAWDDDLDWWRRCLDPPPPPLALPTDRPRPAERSHRGRTLRLPLPASTARGVRALALGEGASLFMTLLAAYFALLHRYSGQDDLSVGTPVAGRRRPEVEPLVGFFVNTLVLRADLGGDPSFRQLLGRVREVSLGAFERQEVPFEDLVDAVQPERDLASTPLFQTMFALQGAPAERLELPGLELVAEHPDAGTAMFDLTLSVMDRGTERADGGLEASLELSLDLFDMATGRRLLDHWRLLLDAALAAPEVPLSRLAATSAAERHQIVAEWNDTAVARRPGDTLTSLVAAQAERSPDAVALVFAEQPLGQHLSYGEAVRRADRLAGRLAALGAVPDRPVGVLLERSLDLPLALLAIHRAGAAYLPLDPDYPPERLRFMVEQAGAAVVVASRDLLARLPATSAVVTTPAGEVVRGGSVLAAAVLAAAERAAAARIAALPDSLAYVIYTSGSTGRPKGAMNGHRGVVNRLLWMQERFPLATAQGTGDRVLHKTPFSFDVSVWELFWPLLAGATMVIARPELHRDSGALAMLVRRQAVTVLHFVPSMLQPFVDEPEVALCAALRRVMVSGEALPFDLEQRFFARLPASELHNLYGPTEAAIDVTHQPGRRSDRRRPVPIGRPVANSRVAVVGRGLEPMPLGVAGELVLGGVQLARGYLGRPGLTAERFVPAPSGLSGGAPGARLYRTGDLARFLPGGTVEFLGRLDFQVKIRGFRIELGEIEAVLAEHPAVREAVAVAQTDGGSAPRLVGYVVAAEIDEADLRRHLEERLPDHMVPAALVTLERMPLTASGKVDRKALPAPDWASRGAAEHRAPRSSAERTLAAIWAEVLGLGSRSVGVDDNFFSLGGDSILGIQVVARANAAGLRLQPRQLFQHQTVAELARVAEAGLAEAGNVPLAEQGPVTGPVPLTPIQRWFFDQPAELGRWKRLGHWNQGVVLRPRRRLAAAPLRRAAARLLEHHDALRLRCEPGAESAGAVPRLRLAAASDPPPVHEIDLTALPASRRGGARSAAAAAVQASLDLQRGPLLRLALLRGATPGAAEAQAAAEGDRALVVAHHLAVDGVSWRVILGDLELAYRAASGEAAAELPPKTASWRQWAEGVGSPESVAAAVTELPYWRHQAHTEVPALPRDGAAAAPGFGREGDGERVETVVEGEVVAALLGSAAAELAARPQELLLTALATALAGWTGGAAVRLALEGHGRDEDLVDGADLSRTVGWFTALYPLLLPAPEAPGLAAALRQVKARVREVPRRGVGFGILRWGDPADAVAAAAELAVAPAPELAFNYLGRIGGAGSHGDLLEVLAEEPGPLYDREAPRRHLLAVDAAVVDGRLRIAWSFDATRHRRSTLAALAAAFDRALAELVDLAARVVAGEEAQETVLVPTDFPLAAAAAASLDEKGLRRLAELARAGDARLEDVYPLTPAQQGMLFHALAAPQAGVFHEQLVCDLAGALDAEAFAAAWQATVERRDVLRTLFAADGFERPVQAVLSRARLPIEHLDWGDLGADEQAARLEAFLDQDRRRGIDPAAAPLARLALIRRSPPQEAAGSWTFVWSFHHLILDGWSAATVLKDVFDLYRRQCGEETAAVVPALAPAPAFAGFVRWLAGRDAEEADRFWRRALHGFAAPTPLGIDRPAVENAAAQRGGGERGDLRRRLPADLSAALDRFGRRHRLTLSTLVHGAWALLLSRYGGAQDVLFGTTVAGRPTDLPGVEAMAGMFINSLPLRVAVAGERPLLVWLAEIQARLVELGPFEHTALSRIQAASAVPAGDPLFDSLVVFENYPVDAALGGGGGSSGVSSEITVLGSRFVERADTPLVLVAAPGERIAVRAGWDRERIGQAAVARLLGHLEVVLAGFCHRPGARLEEISPLLPGERQQLLVEWNEPRESYPGGGLLHQVFRRSAARTPDAVAVVGSGVHLSYGALAAAVDRLARRLRCRLDATGSAPEALVAIAVERSPEQLAGLLAILEAGAAYVPLDPTYPRDRLRTILEDSGAQTLVTDSATARRLQLPATTTLLVDGLGVASTWSDDPAAAAGEAGPPGAAREIDPDALAYVIHTSGSTGRPKGVMIPHRGVVNRLRFAPAAGHLRPGDRFLYKASIGFDVSLLEIFLPWLAGGTVVLAEPGGQQDPAYLAGLMAREQVTQAIFPPSLLRLLVEGEGLVACRALHSVASSAEALPVELQRRFYAALDADLYNRYGPTEASIAATSWRTDRPTALRALRRIVPIGRPIARAEIHLLARGVDPVPLGASGELCIGGPGLARGYLGRPARTAASFVPDPLASFAGRPGARLYRTGDLARYREDGAIEFLGRADHQVKIRGFRVELGEVEAAIGRLAAIGAAVVVDREDAPGARRLVAYVTAAVEEGTAAVDPSTVRRALASSLPDYMVPAAVVVLDALPLNPNGKIDRARLPAPEITRDQASAEYAAARGAAERVLVAIWQEVLGLDTVGAEDDFFELGGDSILSLRVVARANEAGLGLSVRQLFESRTVRRLAQVAGAVAPAAEQETLTGPVPLTPIQRRFFAADPPVDLHWVNQSLVLSVAPAVEASALAPACQRLLTHHDGLRLRFERRPGEAGNGEWRQRYDPPGGPPVLTTLDLSALPAAVAERQRQAAASRLQSSLDLDRGPLVRFALLLAPPPPGGGPPPRRLLALAHHLVVDGVSWRVLLEDLERLCRDPRAPLPPKTLSYRGWAERLAERAAALEVAAEMPWWRDQLAAVGRLPVDFGVSGEPPGGLDGGDYGSESELLTTLPEELAEGMLTTVAEAYGVRPDEALLAALARAVAGWSGRPSLAVDLERHGRDAGLEAGAGDADPSRTVGWFTAIYPVALRAETGESPIDTLVRVKETMRRVPGGGLGFGLLRWLDPGSAAARELARLPAPEVSFNYLGRLDRASSSSGLFALTDEPAGRWRSPRGQRRYLLEVVASRVEEGLSLRWSYSERRHRPETVATLAERFAAAVEEVVEACRQAGAPGYTPSDFGDVDLDQSALDNILAQVGELPG